jgi:hypothetical protein
VIVAERRGDRTILRRVRIVHALKEKKGNMNTTKCGQTGVLLEASIWNSDVTCRGCLGE